MISRDLLVIEFTRLFAIYIDFCIAWSRHTRLFRLNSLAS